MQLSRKFSVPKSSDRVQWQKVEFLVKHGFFFYSVYELRERGTYYRVAYPDTLHEAREFVIKYRQ
ncbi:hypothetical protein C4K68_04245 [Pokkaliibacter plantistimulans]|uniref:Uncharacterized protein n=1 Tax=Proteobacteria bacterium 228 TaxID=2083153 RepID=A0A2S5KVP8_9PROT|nr:hypothetical protein C4K68_04245 [Pokkaliibacter plantistimulans]